MKKFIPFLGLLLMACSSEPTNPPAPDWVHEPARKVDNGYIVYVESADDVDLQKAKFKAEAAALEDLANECSFIPKEARVEDRYEQKTQYMHEAYAKVAIELQVCTQAQKTIVPDEIQKLANVPMTEEVKRYQDLLGKADVADVGDEDDTIAPIANTQAGSASPAYRDEFHFYVVREQIWQANQVVVLSPPATYAPGAPATEEYNHFIQARAPIAAQYVAAHPQINSTPTTWSHYRPQVMRTYGAVGRPREGQAARRPPSSKGQYHPPAQQQQQHRRRRGEQRED